MKKYIRPSENSILMSLVCEPFVPFRAGIQASLYAERHMTTKSKHIEYIKVAARMVVLLYVI